MKYKDLVPTNWTDPLLTGKESVIGKPPFNCIDIENLLRAVRQRIATAENMTSARRRTKKKEVEK
jgi:hypothetical protein